jgi:hypothetical protein
MLPIYARSPEPTPGSILFYSQRWGTLQGANLRPDLPKGLYIMPVTERDTDNIVGYCYHSGQPEFMYSCQWVAVPYNGGPVQRRIDVAHLVDAIPQKVATVTLNNCDYDRAYGIGGLLNEKFPFAQVEYPTIISGTSNTCIKMTFPLVDADEDKFVSEFTKAFTTMGLRNFTISLEKKTPENWKH